jgi:hypothetical protein
MAALAAHRRILAIATSVAALNGTLWAQTAGPTPQASQEREDEAADQAESTEVEGVTVRPEAHRPQYGAVVGDIKPVLQIPPAVIQSYGVSTLTELLNEIAPQVRSDRGRGGSTPVVLLNGRRISGFAEVQNIPTEAILRVDILPEEESLKYGYSADQQVVNIVLRRRFRATTGEAAGGTTTEGGDETAQAEADQFRVRRDSRLNLDLKYQYAAGLTEAERDLIQPPGPGGAPPTPGSAAAHSLLPQTQQLTANAVVAQPIFWGINATMNASLGATKSNALQGLAPQSEALVRQEIDGWTGHLAFTLNKDPGRWRLSLTGAYDHGDSITTTGEDLPPGTPQAGTARAITDSGNLQILANGPLLKLPAGDFYVSAKLGDTANAESANANLAGRMSHAALSRNDVQGVLNLDLPIASRDRHVLGFLGDLTFNVNSALDDYSDFGVLPTLGYGIDWTPADGFNLIISDTHDHAAPTVQQLNDPLVATPGVRLFDFVTGQTTTVTQITGGYPALKADDRDVVKAGLTLKPFPKRDFTFSATFIKSHIDNPIVTFPAPTAEIEAAFPDRFLRDASGDIIVLDDRAVNFATQDRQELRWGVNFSMPVGKQPPPPEFYRQLYQRRRANGQGFGGPDRGGGFGGRRGFAGPPLGGRFQVAFYHTIVFVDRYRLTPGGSVLDLLNGAPAGKTGGQYQHELEGQLGYTDHGYGVRLSANWRSPTTVVGSADGGTLNFSAIGTINLRLWDDFTSQRSLVQRHPALRGVRVSLNITNLFNQSLRVRDSAGTTPVAYQTGFLDPTGRVISLNLRKIFY